jgi:hypothetical protein
VEGWLTVDVLAEVETRVAIIMRVIAVVVVLRTADVFFVNFAFFSFAMELQLGVALFGLMSGNYLKLFLVARFFRGQILLTETVQK